MSKEKQLVVASAYFASDDVIYAVRHDNATTGERIDRVPVADSVPDEEKMDADLRSAALGINSLLWEHEKIRAVVLICPGPFRTIDKRSHLYGEIGWNAEVRYWREKNAIAMFRKHLTKELGRDAKDVEIYIHNQAGVTAVGEYLHTYGDLIRRSDSRGMLHKQLGNHLYVVADYSIDAALIVEGEPFHGLSTMNVGHHAVIPVDEDDETLERLKCSAHPDRPCLNSLASLDAIKKRWPDLHSEKFKECTDLDKVSRIAFYIAQMLANVILSVSPAKVVIGGRIKENPLVIPTIREHLDYLLRDSENPEIYPGYSQINGLENFLVEQSEQDSGVKGGLHVLARTLTKEHDVSNITSFEAYKKGLYPL